MCCLVVGVFEVYFCSCSDSDGIIYSSSHTLSHIPFPIYSRFQPTVSNLPFSPYRLPPTVFHLLFSTYCFHLTVYHLLFPIFRFPLTFFHLLFPIFRFPLTVSHVPFIIYPFPPTVSRLLIVGNRTNYLFRDQLLNQINNHAHSWDTEPPLILRLRL